MVFFLSESSASTDNVTPGVVLVSLTREPAAAAQRGQLQEGRRESAVPRRVVPVDAVGDVENVEIDVKRSIPSQPRPPPGPDIDLEIVGADRAVAAALRFHVRQRIHDRATVSPGRKRISQFAVLIHIDIAIEDRERRAAHPPQR